MEKKVFPDRVKALPVQPIAPGLLPAIKPADLAGVACRECKSTRFIPVAEIKIASQFQTVTGQPMLVNFQGGFACIDCGSINKFDKNPDGTTHEKTGKVRPEDIN